MRFFFFFFRFKSCAPNAFFFLKDHYGCCMTIRPIRQGDQIFINYLGDRVAESKPIRLQNLMNDWDFACFCERCIERKNIEHFPTYETPHYHYITNHQNDCFLPFGSEKRLRLRSACADFLRTFGDIWTNTLDSVTKLFILSSCP